MKILHIVQSLDPAWGGIARVLPALTGELACAGVQCSIATLAGGRFGEASDVPSVEVLRFTANCDGGLGRSKEFDSRIGALIDESDVVHIHGLWTGQNWSTGKAARARRKPYIITPHSMMMPWAWKRSGWKKRPIGMLFEHRNLRNAALLHALAPGEADAIRALGFNDKIEVIPNGIRVRDYEQLPAATHLCEKFPAIRDKRWLLFLGRIHPQKGILQAMQACFDLLAAANDWHLIIAGPDEVGMRSPLEAGARRKGAAERVTFTGQLNRQEVLEALGGAKLLLQPSMSEGLSMSIIEALASGVPVVISPQCNMPEVAARNAGRIVESDRRAIAATLKQLITGSDKALAEMTQNARQLAREKYDWAGLIPKYIEMYTRLARQ